MSFTIDPQNTKDISGVPLDHPGAHDPTYRKRRDYIAQIAQDFWKAPDNGVPEVAYTKEEMQTWKEAVTKLTELHNRRANATYLKARKTLGITTEEIPQFAQLNTKLKSHNFSVRPIGGLVDAKTFLTGLKYNTMLCTQYIRHGSNPQYTPEPDVVHELIGHVPMFTNDDFLSFQKMIGEAAENATPDQVIALERLYWFTVEFGLIEEHGDTKVFGAGLLSSFGEMEHCFSADVDRRAFDIEDVINTEYDFTKMQETLFIIPSFEHLRKATKAFIDTF